ncbi:AAA ATPase family protein [Metarhizium robertsii]|uniref:AAA ATPase family protein n=1 Tax=Metarhizium robertsii TaxID=568076 RepID=A0A0A1V8R3_9HYPO|nr:AAA ATPase family protein [Metarhizium robertsii]
MNDDPNTTSNSALKQVLSHLQYSENDDRQVVIMTCGISGHLPYRRTLVKKLPNSARLSVDSYIYENYGLFKIDYPEGKYPEYQAEGLQHVKAELIRLLGEKQKDIVLDLAFWNRKYREEYKEAITKHGGRWLLVFLDADKEVLRRRIADRRAQRDALSLNDKRRDGDTAFDVDNETFEMYWDGFERPVGEGEIVIKVL